MRIRSVLVFTLAATIAVPMLAGGCAKQPAEHVAPSSEGSSGTSSPTATPSSPPSTPSSPILTTSPAEPAAGDPPPRKGVTERKLGYITKLRASDGSYTVSADYIQLLTGRAAADAATAAGEESPPPNDYFITNENPRIRTFPVAAGTRPRVRMADDASAMRSVTLAQFAALHASDESYRRAPYRLDVEDGIVVAIEQQYLP